MANDAMAEVDELKKRLAQNPDSLIFVPLADAYRKAGLLQEAIDVCKKGLEKHPTYMSARVVLGRIYGDKEMLDEAVEELKRVESVDVDNIMVHTMLGNVYIKKKMYAQAIEQFQRVLSLNPEDTETQEKLQEALSAKQAPASAAPEKKPEQPKAEAPKPAAAAAKPEPPKTDIKSAEPKLDANKSMKAAELYTKKEEFDKAIEIYKELLDKEPGNVLVEQRLREVYDFQEKKLQKSKARPAEPARKVDADKITTEDILDAMKKAVEDDKVDEEPAKAAPAAKPDEAKKETHSPAAETKPAEAKPAEVKPAESKPAPAPKAAEPVKTDRVDPAKAKQLEGVLHDLNEVEGIVGSFILQRDGTIVASVLPKSFNAAETGKLIANIVEKTEQSVRSMNQGKLNQVVISSETGQLLFTEVVSCVLFIIGNEQINVGKMRLMLKDIIIHIKNVLE
jgi:predicted regulator of Ras-like GTPase activity (Roadblock/LC7/MglB family)/predicted Zn-dependent protease